MWFTQTYIPRGFYPDNWKNIIQRFKYLYTLDSISEAQWEDLYRILVLIVEGRLGALRNFGKYADLRELHGKMISGIHSEEALGTPAPDYYSEEAIIRTLKKTRTWNRNAKTIVEHLAKVVDSLISKTGEYDKKKKERIKYKESKSSKTEEDSADESYKDEVQEDYIIHVPAPKPYKGDIEDLAEPGNEDIYPRYTEDEVTSYIIGLFEGDEQAIKYVKLRLSGYERSEIIEEFNGDAKQVDALAARFKYTINKPDINKDIYKGFAALVSDLEDGYKRLIEEILKDVEDHKEEFIKGLDQWFDDLDEWINIEEYTVVSHIWGVEGKNQVGTSDRKYAVRIKYDNRERILILLVSGKELGNILIYPPDEAPKLYDYKGEDKVSDEIEKWLRKELEAFHDNPFQ